MKSARRSARSAIGRTMLLGALLPLYACARGSGSRSPEPELKVALGIKNNSYFDVNVYALPSLSTTRVRIGNVVGFSATAFIVPKNALRQGNALQLYLHAIGSSRYWISPEIAVSSELQACLQIYADPSGDLSRSMFYAQQAPEPDERGRTTVCSTITMADARGPAQPR